MKQVWLRGGITFTIMMGIALLLFAQDETDQAHGTFYAGLIFTIVAMATVLYEHKQWSLLKKSIIHFVCMFITVYPLLLLSGWFSLDQLTDYLLVFLVFIGAGVLSWTIGILITILLKKKE